MKLLNFELSKPAFAIELLGLGFTWDLHNSWRFVGLTINASDNTAVMTWIVDGHPAAMYSGCNLVFRGLKQIIISRGTRNYRFRKTPAYRESLN